MGRVMPYNSGGFFLGMILCAVLTFTGVFFHKEEAAIRTALQLPIIVLNLENARVVGYAFPPECRQAKVILGQLLGYKDVSGGVDCSNRRIVFHNVWDIALEPLAEKGYVISVPVLSREKKLWL